MIPLWFYRSMGALFSEYSLRISPDAESVNSRVSPASGDATSVTRIDDDDDKKEQAINSSLG